MNIIKKNLVAMASNLLANGLQPSSETNIPLLAMFVVANLKATQYHICRKKWSEGQDWRCNPLTLQKRLKHLKVVPKLIEPFSTHFEGDFTFLSIWVIYRNRHRDYPSWVGTPGLFFFSRTRLTLQ